MILVTGATGNVGTQVVNQLAAAGHKVRALVMDKQEGAKLATTVDTVVGDLDNTDSLVNAMRGVERVYMLAPLTPSLEQHERNVIAAAKQAGVKHVVKHSVLGAQYEGIALAKWHRAGEKALEASGLAWTHLRPSAFTSNAFFWLQSIKQGNAVYAPAGDGKLAVIDPRDIAAVAVKTLTTSGHEGQAYEITGPRALSTKEQVEILGKAIGKQLSYVDVPPEAARDGMAGMMPPVIVDAMLEFYALIKSGQASLVTDTVQKLTGKAPRTFESWAQDNAAAFK